MHYLNHEISRYILLEYKTTSMETKDMSAAKQNVEAMLAKLPDECTLEDIQYHLYVLEKIQSGVAAANDQGELSQEEVETRLNKWITE